MITEPMIHEQVLKLLAVAETIPSMTVRFKTKAESRAHSTASFENEDQKEQAQEGARETLRQLSEERASAILDEIETCIKIARAASLRVFLLLHHGPEIYTPDDHERSVRDRDVHQSQTLLYIERARNFFPAATSHLVSARIVQLDRIEQDLSFALKSYTDAAAMIERMDTKPDPVHATTARQDYGQVTFELGCLHRELIEKSIRRIENVFGYVDLINENLLPLQIGDSENWFAQKLVLLQESLGSLENFSNHLEGAKGYFTQALNFSEETKPAKI